MSIPAASTLAVALEFASEDIPVFPCLPMKKAPLTIHGFKDATVDEDQIHEWFSKYPGANLAVPTGPISGIDVLDIDVKAGNGFIAFDRLRRMGLVHGAFRIVTTPSGGLHLYYRANGRRSSSIRSAFIDYKAAGGYVLVPPSVVGGTAYVEIDSRPLSQARELDWPRCQSSLRPPRGGRARPRKGGTTSNLTAWLARQPEGNRNNATFWATLKTIEEGGDVSAIEDAAVMAGLPVMEARRTIESAMRFR